MKRAETFAKGKIWVMNIHIVLSSYLFLYTMGVFNPCQDNVAASLNWGSNKDLYVTIFSSIVTIGALFGTAITAYLIDRFGRRTTTMMIDIVYLVGTIILVMPSTVTFAIGRFITGFGAGIFMTLGPIYVTEVTPEAMISKVGPIIVIANNLGLLSAYGFGLALPVDNFENESFNYWWLFMFLFPGAVCIYQFCYFKFVCIYDTPQYYMARGMTAQANAALGIAYTPEGLAGGLRRLDSEIKGKFVSGIKPSIVSLFLNKRYRKMVRVGSVVCILNQLSGVFAIVFYSTEMFKDLGGGVFLSRILTFIMGIVNLFSSIISILLLQWLGRKTLLVSGHIFLAADLFLLALFSGYIDGGVAAPAIFTIAFFLFFSYSLAATLWLYVGEVLNDQILSVCCVMNTAMSVIITFLFPPVASAIGINNTFLFFSGMMILGAIYCFFDLVETKNKEKEQILVEMKVLEKRVTPGDNNNEGDSLQEEVDNGDEQGLKEKEDISFNNGLDATVNK